MNSNNQERYIGGAVDLSYLANSAVANDTAQAQGFVTPGSAQQLPGAAPSQKIDIPGVVFEVSEANFDSVVQLSSVVPAVLLLVSAADENQQQTVATLSSITRKSGGKIVLGIIDAETNPQLAQAFRAAALPAAMLMLAGQPQKLFEGAQQDSVLAELFTQIIQLAASQGMSGAVNAPDLDGDTQAEPAVNPKHAAALAATEAGDYATAVAEYDKILANYPRDHEAVAARAQVNLLLRLQGAEAERIRKNAADQPHSVDAQLAVADLDIAGGHVEDGFLRLLDVFTQKTDADERKIVQSRLLELFEVVGVSDPRVIAARRQLANILY